MSDLSDRLNPYKLRAQRHKKAAMQARRGGDSAAAEAAFEEARLAMDEAFEEIESRGRFNTALVAPLDQATKDQASELADCWGIRGGIYREEGQIDQAIAAYDRGYAFEREPKYEIQSTYNTINRLVLRLLTNPGLLKEGGSKITDQRLDRPLVELLAEAAQAIDAKWRFMTDPVWALADMVLVTTILQTPDAPEWEERFKTKAQNRFPFDSLRAVLERLSQADLPISGRLHELAGRLERYVTEKWPPQAAGGAA